MTITGFTTLLRSDNPIFPVLAKGLEGGEGSPLLITIMTDFENSRDHPWMQDQGQIIICGTLVSCSLNKLHNTNSRCYEQKRRLP